MALPTRFNIDSDVDPQGQGGPAAQQLNGSLGLSGLGHHINIYCHTVIIERPVSVDRPDPVYQSPLKGMWVRSGGIPNFIKTLYWNILDRDAENETVIDGWTNDVYVHGLAHTVAAFFTALKTTARGQQMSTEALVDKIYLAVLCRRAEEKGKMHWIEKLGNGASFLKIAEGFIGSVEYRGKVQAGTAPDPIRWPSS